MYNEIASRYYSRSRMNEAQELVKNERLLSSLEGHTEQVKDRKVNNSPGILSRLLAGIKRPLENFGCLVKDLTASWRFEI